MKAQEKYAPQSLDDVIFANDQTGVLVRAYAEGQLDGHLILWGPNGTGKTALADLMPALIAGADASVESKTYDELMKLPDLGNYFRQTCHMSGLMGQGKHFVIFHEFDEQAGRQAKLWTAIDKCLSDVMLIITTNHPMRISNSFRSRCDCIEMPALTPDMVLPRAQHILRAEGLDLSDAQVLDYLRKQVLIPDLRKYFGLLDKLLLLSRNGMSLPAWSPAPPQLVSV